MRLTQTLTVAAALSLAACGSSETPSTPAPDDAPKADAGKPDAAEPPAPEGPAAPTGISGNIPKSITLAATPDTGENNIGVFDEWSWQTFVALTWPSNPGTSGTPVEPDNPAAYGKYDGKVPVFLGWKQDGDLFPVDGSEPPAWTAPSNNLASCKNADAFAGKGLPVFTDANNASGVHGATPAREFYQPAAGYLIDTTGHFLHAGTAINQAYYDTIRDNGFYLTSKLLGCTDPKDASTCQMATNIQMPMTTADGEVGALSFKASWREMAGVPEASAARYFQQEVVEIDLHSCEDPGSDKTRPSNCECKAATYGLQAAHIGHKMAPYKDWVWATFEQVDIVGGHDNSQAPFALQDPAKLPHPEEHPGHSGPSKDWCYASHTPMADKVVTNVARTNPIHPSTKATNAAWRKNLAATPFAHYQLAASQWSTKPEEADSKANADGTVTRADGEVIKFQGLRGDFGCTEVTPKSIASGAPFPECNVSDLALETWFPGNSCQNCHVGSKVFYNADSTWLPLFHAYDDVGGMTLRAIVKAVYQDHSAIPADVMGTAPDPDNGVAGDPCYNKVPG